MNHTNNPQLQFLSGWNTSLAEETLGLYSAMQDLNGAAMKYIAGMMKVGMNLRDIKTLCENYLLENGADSFWYRDVGAFVFSGDETSQYGYKREDIYYFDNGKLIKL